MKMRTVFVLCLSAVLLVPGCTTAPTDAPQAVGSPEPAPRPSEYRTFAIAPMSTQGPSSDPGAPARLNEVARAAIVESLSGKGFRETTADAADFIVTADTEFSRDPIFESSEKRHLYIAFHDRVSQSVVWSAQRGRSSSRTLEPDLVRKTIIDMLAPVPPAGSAR